MGEVTELGSKVKKTKVGDRVGVGGVVGACNDCDTCNNDLEIYCPKMVLTYSSIYHDGTVTYGGYSDTMVANERYIVHFPDNMPLDGGDPLLCAGITMYSPLKYFGLAEPGKHIGIVGLGGLGHVGVKFAKAFGAKVTVISTSPSKKDEALNHLGADEFLVSRDQDQMQVNNYFSSPFVIYMFWYCLGSLISCNCSVQIYFGFQLQAAMGTFDGIIDTISAVHPIVPLIGLLKSHGKLILVGAPEKPLELPVFPLIMGKHKISGYVI